MMESLIWNTREKAIRGSTGSIRKRLRWQSKPLQNIVMETQTCYQGAIQGGMDPRMDANYSTNQLLNMIVANQLNINQLLNVIVANQQKKPESEHKRKSHKRHNRVNKAKVAKVAKKQLLVTQKPQVCETWSGFPNFTFAETLQVA